MSKTQNKVLQLVTPELTIKRMGRVIRVKKISVESYNRLVAYGYLVVFAGEGK